MGQFKGMGQRMEGGYREQVTLPWLKRDKAGCKETVDNNGSRWSEWSKDASCLDVFNINNSLANIIATTVLCKVNHSVPNFDRRRWYITLTLDGHQMIRTDFDRRCSRWVVGICSVNAQHVGILQVGCVMSKTVDWFELTTIACSIGSNQVADLNISHGDKASIFDFHQGVARKAGKAGLRGAVGRACCHTIKDSVTTVFFAGTRLLEYPIVGTTDTPRRLVVAHLNIS
mmetsp:Transcript_30944/g.51129  ORF Transcript_30944/g.51129 Transcript_30944/m.51129 type:complete len:229 (+) Transcript_30944:569-1255(+)